MQDGSITRLEGRTAAVVVAVRWPPGRNGAIDFR